MEEAIKLGLAFLFGTGLSELIKYLREKHKAKAELTKLLVETDNQSFTIRSELLQKWINVASTAEEKISELRMQVATEKIARIPLEKKVREYKNIEAELKRCKESMERCKKTHGCSETETILIDAPLTETPLQLPPVPDDSVIDIK